MDAWQSGLLPYPVLLASQIVVLTFMTMICVDFVRQRGFFVEPHPRGGVSPFGSDCSISPGWSSVMYSRWRGNRSAAGLAERFRSSFIHSSRAFF
jgi:hypothetical protein